MTSVYAGMEWLEIELNEIR